MLLYKLLWMCHGVKLNLKEKRGLKASLTDELSSQQSLSMRSGSSFDTGALIMPRDSQPGHVDEESRQDSKVPVKSTNPYTMA